MKTEPKIIELKQAPVVLVELPNENYELMFISPRVYSYDTTTDDWNYVGKDLMCLGILPDLTEDDFAECVPKEEYSHIKNPDAIWYEAYFYSLLESEKVYVGENPFGEKPHIEEESMWGVGELDTQVISGFQYDLEKWQEAESRTINPARTVVLIKRF